jgi:hypothetical protein
MKDKFFIADPSDRKQNRKGGDQFNKRTKNGKRPPPKRHMRSRNQADEELSSEEEEESNKKVNSRGQYESQSDEEVERETAPEKRLRLAKALIDQLKSDAGKF